MSIRVNKRIQNEYKALLKRVGDIEFYNYIVKAGILSKRKTKYPEIIMLNQSELFFSLYKTTCNSEYFTIGKILRRAAHKLYRNNKHTNYPKNNKFLHIITV